MRRRELLRTMLVVLTGECSGVAGQVAAHAAGPAQDSVDPAARSTDTRPLTDAERDALVAFAEVLVGSRPLSPPERHEVLMHIVYRASTSEEILALYRDAATLLEKLAGAPFAALTFRARSDLLVRHRLVPSRGVFEAPDQPATPIRRRVAPDLIAGYYAAPMGWAVVGYGVFPGRCGDLTRYTRAEA